MNLKLSKRWKIEGRKHADVTSIFVRSISGAYTTEVQTVATHVEGTVRSSTPWRCPNQHTKTESSSQSLATKYDFLPLLTGPIMESTAKGSDIGLSNRNPPRWRWRTSLFPRIQQHNVRGGKCLRRRGGLTYRGVLIACHRTPR